MRIEIGIVITQVSAILPTMLQLIDLGRKAVPVPIMEDVMTCVVDKGMPRWVNVCSTIKEETSEAKPFTGSILIIFLPIVLIIRHPPSFLSIIGSMRKGLQACSNNL